MRPVLLAAAFAVFACGAVPFPTPATYEDDVLGLTYERLHRHGLTVADVQPNSLADRLGLVPGDVLDAASIRIGRRHVRTYRIGTLRQIARFYEIVRSTPDARAFGFRFDTADGPRTVTFGVAILTTPPPIAEPYSP